MKCGDLCWADLGAHRPQQQTGRRPVIVWQSDALNRVLQPVLVVPLTTNLDRARLAGTAIIAATPDGLPPNSVALAFQLRAIRSRPCTVALERLPKPSSLNSSSPPTKPWVVSSLRIGRRCPSQ
ncbi:MAG: type II toxin-antitoxin system PemK/MazF family toxin, partial [Polyangiaceae bacterium]